MISVVSLLVAAALVSQQCGFEANAAVHHYKHLDNHLKPNVSPPKRGKQFSKYVKIQSAPGAEVRRAAGEVTVLECQVIGNPAPAAYWMRNGEVLQDPSDEVNEIVPFAGLADLTSRLVITGSEPGEDEYTCVAQAGAKRDVATTTVYTLPIPSEDQDLLALNSLISSKPLITYYYKALFSLIGSPAFLPCRVHGQATPDVQWVDGNGQAVYNNNRMRVLPSGDLLINSLSWADLGGYTCVAENVFGKEEASTFVYPVQP